MIRRFLVEHREWAGCEWRSARLGLALARTTSNSALIDAAFVRLAAARRSIQRADFLLDLWTFGGRR